MAEPEPETEEQSQALQPSGPPPPPVGLPVAARPKPLVVERGDAAGGDAEAAERREADVRAMAWYLGMNLVLDEAHMGIAEQALGAVLLEGWSEELDAEGRMYYWRTDEPAAEAQWEHPADAAFRRQLLEARADGGTAESIGVGLTVAEPPMPGMFRPTPGAATVEELAEYLGMDLSADRGLLWIADAALAAGMPEGWSMHETTKGPPFFHNSHFGITQWEHPTDQFFRSMYLAEKAKLETGESPDVKLARPMPRTMPKDKPQPLPSPPKVVKGDTSMIFGGGDPDVAEKYARLKKISPLGVTEPRRVRRNRRATLPPAAPKPVAPPGDLGPLDELHIRVIEAKELRPVDTFGLSDPLVHVIHSGPLGRDEARSPAVRRTLNPTFIGAAFTFGVAPSLTADTPLDEKVAGWGSVEITVMDEAPATVDVSAVETILGVVTLELAGLKASANGGFGMQRWLELQPSEGASWKAQGQVHIMAQILPGDSSTQTLVPAPEVEASANGDAETEYTETDVRDMAVYLGMNPLTDEHLFWLAEEALCASLPVGWNPVVKADGVPVFVDARTGLESAEHPMDPCFRNIFFREKEAERLFEVNEWQAVQAEAEMLQRAMLEAELQEESEIMEGAPRVRDDAWKQVAKIPVPDLLELVFTMAGSNADQASVMMKGELANEIFGESLAEHWDDIALDPDTPVTREDFDTFFDGLQETLGENYEIFVIDMVWTADVDVTALLPPPKMDGESSDDALGMGNITADWEDSQVMQSQNMDQMYDDFMEGTGEELPPEPISAVAVEYMAKFFGVDMSTETELVTLVQQAVCAALPDNIVERTDPDTGETSWLDTMTSVSQTSHPFEASTKARLLELRAEIETMRARRADRLAVMTTLDQGGIDLPPVAMVDFQRVVGLVDLLGPAPTNDDRDNWKGWPKQICGTHPQAWVAFVQPNGAGYYQHFGAESEKTTVSSPYDWPSLEEVTMQLHWYYRLHDGAAAAEGMEVRGRVVRQPMRKAYVSPLSAYDPAKRPAMPPSESGAHHASRKVKAPTSRTGELAVPKAVRVVEKSNRSYYEPQATAAERSVARKIDNKHARCIWLHRNADKDVDAWLRKSVRQGHFTIDTAVVDHGKYGKYIERLQTQLMKDEMQYGSGDPRVEQGAYLLCMMCNVLGQREMALGNHVPALQLFKQAEQASDPAIGYPFPARQQCRAWTLDSLAYYYEKRGKHRGAYSYLQKAFQALVATDGNTEPSPFRGVDILLHTGYVAAKVRDPSMQCTALGCLCLPLSADGCLCFRSQMFNYEQSAMSSRAAVMALHSLAPDDSAASTPDAIRAHVRPHHQPATTAIASHTCALVQLRMLSIAYNNLAVGLFGMGLESDLPALQMLVERAAATADLASAAPGGDLRNSHAVIIRDNVTIFAMVRITVPSRYQSRSPLPGTSLAGSGAETRAGFAFCRREAGRRWTARRHP